MLQMFSVVGFKWVKITSKFNKDFTSSFSEDSYIRYFLKFDVQYPERFHKL